MLGAGARDKPPDYDRTAGTLLIDSTNFEFIQPLFERASIAHLIAAGDAYTEIERRLHADTLGAETAFGERDSKTSVGAVVRRADQPCLGKPDDQLLQRYDLVERHH